MGLPRSWTVFCAASALVLAAVVFAVCHVVAEVSLGISVGAALFVFAFDYYLTAQALSKHFPAPDEHPDA